MTDIMSDLGDVWDTLGSVEKSNISFSLAGTRQGNIIKSLVNNWDSYKSLVEKANDSSGITLENQNKHAESLAGKLAELKAVWESIWTNALSSQTLKDVVDFGTSISTVVSKLGLLKTALLTVAGITVFRNFGNIKSVISDLGKVQAAVNSMSAMGTLNNWQMWNDGSLKTATLVKYSAQVEGLSLKNAQLALSTTTLSTAQKEQVLVQAGLVASNESINASLLTQAMSNTTIGATEKENILTKAGLTTATSTCTAEKLKEVLANSMVSSTDADVIVAQLGLAAATDTTAVSFGVLSKAMLTFLATNPIGWLILAGTAIYAGVKAFDYFTVSLDEATKSMEDAKASYDEATTSIDDLSTQLDDCKDKIKSLQEQADNETISITDEEELNTLKETNTELERQLKLQQEKQKLAAIDEVNSASDALNSKVKSDYVKGQVRGMGSRVDYLTVTPQEELQNAITEYSNLQDQIDSLNKSYGSGDISASDYEKQMTKLTDSQTDAESRASEMNDTIDASEQAYADLTNAGGVLKESQQNEYNSVKQSSNGYYDFIDSINGASNATDTATDSTKNFTTATYEAVDATTALSNASSVLDELKTAYEGFTDDGFVLASTLSALPDELKNLKGFDLFSQIVGDPTSGTEKIQQAFNDITKQYLLSEDTLGGLVNASSSTVQSYIANLKAMGISNAEEVVNEAYNAINSENELITNATKEYEGMYQKYLQTKNEGDLAYLNDSASNNSKLADALGSTYSSDYDNWTKLLQNKALAYNQFVSAITGSQLDLGSGSSALSAKGQAQSIVNEASGKKVLSSSDKFASTTTSLLTGSTTGSNISQYTSEQVASAQQYLEYANQLSTMTDALKLDLSTVSTNFGTTFSPSSSGSASSAASSATDAVAATVEQVDFVAIAIERVESAIDKLKTKAENTFKSFTYRNTAYKSELKQATKEINLQQAAYQTYMNRANSIGLSGDWASQVRNGSVNIADISDDTLKQQISDYQDYYEKAMDAKDAISELKTTQIELTQAKIETLITKYEKLGSVAETANDKIQNKIDLKESWGGSASVKNYTDMNKNIQTQIKYINKQASQLKLLQKTVKKGSEAWYEYKSEIDDNKSSLTDLQSQMAENATAAAQLAAAKASNKVEIYDTRDELYQAKSDNSTSSTTANKYIDKEIADIAKRQTAYNAAVSTDKSNLKSSSKSLTKTKKKKENKSILKKIKSAIKSKKEISASILNSTRGLGDNDSLYNKCVKYNAYLTSYETDKATADLYKQTSKQDKADKATEKMTNIEDYYSERQGVIEQKETQINNAISLAEAQGYRTSKKYYSKLASLEKSNNASLVTERAKLVASLATSIEDGSIARYSPEWYKLNQQIDDVTNSIDESSLSLADFVNEMNQIDWSNFESLQDAISNVTSESDFMISQLSRDDLSSDDTGGLTDAGKAVVALRYSNYDTYMKQAENYEDEILSINKQLATDPYNETLLDQKETYVQAYQDAISGAQDEKYAVLDLVEQGYDALENKIADLVADYEDLLDAEKDAYDYQESIAEKTKSITDIKKQLQTYSNDASEEAKSKIQSLTVSLSDAETDLQDTQYDKMISNTKDMLSDLQDNLSDYVDDVISSLSENFTDLESTINSSIKDVGTTITDAMTGIGYTPTTEFKSLIGNFSSGKDIETSTNTVVKTITNFQNAMITYADKIAASVSTITASTDVNSKIRSDGGKSLSTDASKAKSKLANEKSEYAKSKYTYKEAYDKYLSYKSKYGVNSSKTKTAHEDYSKAKKAYLEEKSEYNTAKLKNTALQYLNTHLDVTTNSRGDLSDINKIFYDEYGMRVLDSSEIKELAKKLSISSTNQSSSGDLYKELKTLKINGFKNGSSSIPYDQTALTQENGQELIANTSDGSLLTRLGTGDKVFTNAMTDNLWNMSKSSNLSSGNVVVSSSGGNPISIDMGGMVIQNASNSKEIVDTMADAIATNTKMKQLLQSVTTNTLSSGYNSLSSRAYK